MLVKHPSSAPTLSKAVWIDLLDPTDEERAQVEQATRHRLPTRANIEEIESSSRVLVEDGVFYLSTPVLEGVNCLKAARTTVGFVLSPEQLVTLRFSDVAAFDEEAASYARVAKPGASDAFLKLLETIVDHAADTLEQAGAELERISHSSFHADRPRRRKLSEASEALHRALRKLGRIGDGISHVRDTLLGLDRIATFVKETGREYKLNVDAVRLQALRGDIASLNDQQSHLSVKIQFLLDATLGFINIQQNDIVKTLTIVSVVGVPPVLIAGVYGMNFKLMPELSWTLGYPFALALIVVSAFLPIAWFKWRGWM